MKIRSMRRVLSICVTASLCLLFPFPSLATQETAQDTATAALKAVVAGAHRAEGEKARDRYRHPVETLSWFGIKENMTVVEIWPGGGWYLNILAPLLKEKGTYYAAAPGNRQRFMDALAVNPELYKKVIVTQTPPQTMDIAPEGSADMVLTFRNVHNWMSGGFAEAAGFKLVDRSEINANSKDTKDHPRGVWTLPPSLALTDTDRDKYLAIGESDRMTLKFMKPKVE
ncbi:MAG: class I SAM-dependent methyltransferase [Candidatus Binatia bacterium]